MNFLKGLSVASLAVFLFVGGLGPSAFGADRQNVVATIGKHQVTAAELDMFLSRSAQDDELPPRTRNYALAILAKQKRALESLRKLGLAADGKAVDAWLDRHAGESPADQSAGDLVASIAESAAVSEFIVRENIAFRLSWKAYLAKHLTKKNIAKHFANQQARFDGTRFDVERIAVATLVGESSVRSQAREVLFELKEKLVNRGDLPLDASAMKDPELDVSERGIELIFSSEQVTGSGEVDSAIVDSVLATPEMQWSAPIDSLVGVHILRVREVKPGDLKFEAVKNEVRAHLLVFLLNYLAEKASEGLPLRLAT